MKSLKYWKNDEFEISSFKYNLSDRVNSIYTTSGSDNTGLCTYTYNELGFRGDSITKEGFKIMSIGCSNTEGVGVNDNETWPHIFSRKFSDGVNMNFGTGGRSNDFICRTLITYHDIIKPDLVLIMYTFTHRREIYTKDNFIEPYTPTSVWGRLLETEEGVEIQKSMDYLQNEHSDFINWYKNHLLIKYFLESKKTNWIWNGIHLRNEYVDSNRFDGEYAPYIDKGVDNIHPGPKTNEKYANTLYNFLVLKFKDYLNINVDKKSRLI